LSLYVITAQALAQERAHARVRRLAGGRIGADVDAFPRMHAVGYVEPLHDSPARRIECMITARIRGHEQVATAARHRGAERDAGGGRRPVVELADVNARRRAGPIAIARAKRRCAARIERDHGAKERRRTGQVEKLRELGAKAGKSLPPELVERAQIDEVQARLASNDEVPGGKAS